MHEVRHHGVGHHDSDHCDEKVTPRYRHLVTALLRTRLPGHVTGARGHVVWVGVAGRGVLAPGWVGPLGCTLPASSADSLSKILQIPPDGRFSA